MMYAEVKDRKIERIVATNNPKSHHIPLANGSEVQVGDCVDFLNKDMSQRKSLEQCIDEGLFTPKEHHDIVWNGRYENVPDFVGVPVWDKLTANPVSLRYGEPFLDNYTLVEPPDYKAEWVNGEWVIPELRDKELLKEAIVMQLNTLDKKAARPLRAILTNQHTQEDVDYLQSLEIQAQQLRDELHQMENSE